nr:hypothetical protein [Tanacetum cinerariifolium]
MGIKIDDFAEGMEDLLDDLDPGEASLVAQGEQELRAQKLAAQEKEEPPQNSNFCQLIGEICGTKVCEEQNQNMEDTMLELLEDCRQKVLYCMHNDVNDLIERTLNSKLLSINLKSQHLDKEKQEVKNIIEHPTKCRTPPDLPTKEPEYSLSMGDEHLSTILETESVKIKSSVKNLVPIPSDPDITFDNETQGEQELRAQKLAAQEKEEPPQNSNFHQLIGEKCGAKVYKIKFSVKNLVPIPSEFEVTSDNKSEFDVPVNDESSPIFTTFSNHLFDCNDDFTFSDDTLLFSKDVSIENLKIYSNSFFDDEERISTKIDPHYYNAESNFLEYLLNQDTLIDSSPMFDFFLKEFSGELAHIDPIPSGIEEADFDLEEEICLVENFWDIDLFLDTDDLMPPGSKNDDYDLDGDIHFLEELFSNDTLPLPENESFNFDHHDDLSFSRPPPEPPDVEIFFDFKPYTGVLISKVMEDISEHHVLMPKVLPTLCPNIDILLLFSSKNEDKVFKPGILSYLLVSHRDKTTSNFSENPIMMYGGYIPLLDVSYLNFYPP